MLTQKACRRPTRLESDDDAQIIFETLNALGEKTHRRRPRP
jgi:hypothetical protein